MKIVFVTTELAASNSSAGGLASFTANIARIFSENGHEVFIILAATQEKHIELDSNISVIPLYVPMKKWKKFDRASKIICRCCKYNNENIRRAIMNLYKARQVQKVIQNLHKEGKIDIIHYCNHGYLNRLSIKNIPHIVRISGLENICKGGATTYRGSVEYKDNLLSLTARMDERAVKKSRYVVAPSHLMAGIVKENIGKNVVVIESPFVLKLQDWDNTVINHYSLNEKRYIIHYGSLRCAKGTYTVAQLAKEFLRLHTEYYLVLAGNNEDIIDERGNKMKADELVKNGAGEFADRVIYVGRLVREQLYPLIKSAELCLLPSRIENLSNACIEAMAMGKIVVATNGASYEQLIEDGISGFLCERDNAEDFLAAINNVLSMSIDEKERLGAKAIEVTKRLEPQKIYQQYLDFYNKVIREW